MRSSLAVATAVPAPGVLLLTPVGELDLQTAAQLRAVFDREVDAVPCPRVVVDLAGVGFLGSAGVAVLLDLADAARARGGRIALAAPSAPARRVLGLLRLERELPVSATLEEALGG